MIRNDCVALGVAQNHSNLFMSPRQRIPGLIEGQIYTYPSKRWRKKRRQYLMNFMQPRRKELDPENELHTISTVENPAATNEDSKDSAGLKDEAAKVMVHVTCLIFTHMASVLNLK
jgi:zinc finger protein ubi-d4